MKQVVANHHLPMACSRYMYIQVTNRIIDEIESRSRSRSSISIHCSFANRCGALRAHSCKAFARAELLIKKINQQLINSGFVIKVHAQYLGRVIRSWSVFRFRTEKIININDNFLFEWKHTTPKNHKIDRVAKDEF